MSVTIVGDKAGISSTVCAGSSAITFKIDSEYPSQIDHQLVNPTCSLLCFSDYQRFGGWLLAHSTHQQKYQGSGQPAFLLFLCQVASISNET